MGLIAAFFLTWLLVMQGPDEITNMVVPGTESTEFIVWDGYSSTRFRIDLDSLLTLAVDEKLEMQVTRVNKKDEKCHFESLNPCYESCEPKLKLSGTVGTVSCQNDQCLAEICRQTLGDGLSYMNLIVY